MWKTTLSAYRHHINNNLSPIIIFFNQKFCFYNIFIKTFPKMYFSYFYQTGVPRLYFNSTGHGVHKIHQIIIKTHSPLFISCFCRPLFTPKHRLYIFFTLPSPLLLLVRLLPQPYQHYHHFQSSSPSIIEAFARIDSGLV